MKQDMKQEKQEPKQGTQALLVVSFGTTHHQTLERSIGAIEADLRAAFPQREFRRAFTSGIIRRKLLRRDGIKVDGVVEALEALWLEGYEDVLVQPTHIINGEETARLRSEVRLYSDQFKRLRVGAPLLTEQRDYELLVNAIVAQLPNLGYDGALALMGHGTRHFANPAYPALEYVFHAMGHSNVFVGTVQGYPTIKELICRLDHQLNARRIYVAPLMVAAGEHVSRDMSGDGPDSWKNQLLENNYQPILVPKGLGEYPGVRELFVLHAREALERP